MAKTAISWIVFALLAYVWWLVPNLIDYIDGGQFYMFVMIISVVMIGAGKGSGDLMGDITGTVKDFLPNVMWFAVFGLFSAIFAELYGMMNGTAFDAMSLGQHLVGAAVSSFLTCLFMGAFKAR